MFSINDYVIYGTTGICKIVDIRKKCFGMDTEKTYYILQPVYSNNSTIYVPIDNDSVTKKMQPILTTEEIYDLIKTMPDEKTFWIADDNLRKEKYIEILKTGDRKELIKLIKTLYAHKKERLESGRKFYAADENIMNSAEKILYEEFALVLSIKPEEVVPFITKQLQL